MKFENLTFRERKVMYIILRIMFLKSLFILT